MTLPKTQVKELEGRRQGASKERQLAISSEVSDKLKTQFWETLPNCRGAYLRAGSPLWAEDPPPPFSFQIAGWEAKGQAQAQGKPRQSQKPPRPPPFVTRSEEAIGVVNECPT